MSATLTCFPVHTEAHMYGHHEMEPQQLYSNDGYNPYLVYSEFPADADVSGNAGSLIFLTFRNLTEHFWRIAHRELSRRSPV
jgi:hypothetical protein